MRMAGAPKRLRSEYLHNPLGIDALRPLLSWQVNDPRPAEIQTAWQVLAASEPGLLQESKADLWDSGRVSDSGAGPIIYGGPALLSRQRVWWTVRTYDSDGLPSAFAQPAFFEVGLLDSADWSGRWIGAAQRGSRSAAAAVPCLIRDFSITAMPRRARLYVAACGYAQVELNGANVGLGMAAPTASDYRRRLRYRSVDVTSQLTLGSNRLGALLFDGRFAGNVTRAEQRQQFGDRPLLLAQLELVSADGRLQRIVSDDQWLTAPSGWLISDPVLGEHFDARQHPPFWSRPSRTPQPSESWIPVEFYPPPGGRLAADVSPVMTEQRQLQPLGAPLVVVDEWHTTALRYEFAEPVYGRVLLDATLPTGGRLNCRYELLADTGRADLHANATDTVTAVGPVRQHAGASVLRRFQAVTLSGDVSQMRPPVIAAARYGFSSDLGLQFETDCEPLQVLQQQLHCDLLAGCAAQPLTGSGLEAGLPATGDLCSLLEVLGRCADSAALLRAWATDLLDAQADFSALPRVVPPVPGESYLQTGGAAEALVQVVWSLYRHHGDFAVLHSAQPAIDRLLAAMADASSGYIWRAGGAQEDDTPPKLIGTAWFYRCACLAAQMSAALGDRARAQRAEALADAVRTAFRRRFVTADGTVASHTQTAALLVLEFGLLDPGERPQCVSNLVKSLRQSGLRVQPGMLGRALLQLCDNGAGALALALMVEPDRSAAFQRRYGRTMLAAGALDWIYGALLGIRLPAANSAADVAYQRLRIAPTLPDRAAPDSHVPLRSVAGRCLTARGEVGVQWRTVGADVQLRIELPADTRAELVLPGRAAEVLAAGVHERALSVPAEGVSLAS